MSITHPLIHSADSTGTQPLFNTGRVYLFLSTIATHMGKSTK